MKFKMTFLCGAAAALVAMGAMTVQTSSTGAGLGGSSANVAIGKTAVSARATTTPATAVPKAGPAVKATTFVGGDWPGMGAFGEDWAK
jgi:hypothetical protein